MVKKRLLALCLLLTVLLSSCGCASGAGDESPTLVIGCDDNEPYTYTDVDGDPAGMDVDLAREACRRMGYTPVFRHIDWNEKDALLAAGTVDCLWSCLAMDGADEGYLWVGPYMNSRQIVAVRESDAAHSLADLADRNIGVRTGTKAEQIFLSPASSGLPTVRNVYSLGSMDELATALRNGYVDAIAGYAAPVREVLQNDGIAFRFLDENLVRAKLGVAFAAGSDPLLRAKLAEALAAMLADGTTARILAGYGVDTALALEGLDDGQ